MARVGVDVGPITGYLNEPSQDLGINPNIGKTLMVKLKSNGIIVYITNLSRMDIHERKA